jgi:hypothetical protein
VVNPAAGAARREPQPQILACPSRLAVSRNAPHA